MSIKPLKPSTHLIFWAGAFVLFVLVITLFKAVLLPFVLGIAVAYLLNPMVNQFKQIGISRGPSALMILISFLIFILAFFGAISPILYREILQFSNDLPSYIEKISNLAAPLTEIVEKYIGTIEKNNIETLIKDNAASAAQVTKLILERAASGGKAVIDLISVAVFMPIVAYFMMKEWENISAWVHGLMPRHSEGVIMDLLKQIDQKLSGFIRGQISVALILGVAYAILLSIAGLKYGLLIGLMSGLLSIIPMVGSTVGLLVSIGVAWFQTGELSFVAIIAGIFIGGQIIEGNFLTPKLVGDSVGLHPLWVFFALLAGGSLLGILGMLLAVPVAAVTGVLIAFAIQKYKQSEYYLGSKVEKVPSKTANKKAKKAEK